jgi:hypothetical protein
MPSGPTRADCENFLVRAYFGRLDDPLKACLKRAYRDVARTLHGIGELQRNPKTEAERFLNGRFECVRAPAALTQDRFDEWHRDTCDKLKRIYEKSGYDQFYVGQSQKWINMTFKYIFTLGEDRIHGYGHLYDFCHIPFDNIIIDKLRSQGFQFRPDPWSHLDPYDTYLEGQNWVRKECNLVPLDVDFRLWEPLVKNG